MREKPWKCISGSGLKIIAMTTMLIDHVACFLLINIPSFQYPWLTAFGTTLTPYFILRLVGRTAFPLYCFLLVEGFHHTRDHRKYGANLLIFALLSEIPWNFAQSGTWHDPRQNVFFTLFLGFCGLYLMERLKTRPHLLLLGIPALLAMAWLLRADYGYLGVGIILCMYLLRQHPILRVCVCACLFNSPWRVLPAFGLMSCYNGERGFIRGSFGKYVCYAFYPLHLALLGWGAYILSIL